MPFVKGHRQSQRRTEDEHLASGHVIKWTRKRPAGRVWVFFSCCQTSGLRTHSSLRYLRDTPDATCLACSYALKPRKKKTGSISNQGYRVVTVDGRPILEHRHVAEQHLGRKLKSTETVHHINGDKLDNCWENLSVMDRGEHSRSHKDMLREVARLRKELTNAQK